MKKISLIVLLIVAMLMASACGNDSTSGTMSLGGVEYDAKFVKSGYYFDKASFSEITLGEMLSKVKPIEKPSYLGEVTLPDFSKIELTNNKREEITDADIEAEIEKEREKDTTYEIVKVKREAKITDKVIIDFDGYVNGEPLEGGSGQDYELILGSGSFIPGFEEKVVGHKAGQKFSIDVVFPEQYTSELAGKPAKFDITIKSIEEANAPEVNDEFVVKHTKVGAKTVEEFNEEMKQRLLDKQEFMNNQNLIYQLYDKLYGECKFKPTEEALAWQFSLIIDQINQQAEQSGTNISTILTSNGGSILDGFKQVKESVPQYIETQMLMDELSKRFKVDMNESQVKEWFNSMSDAMGYGNQITYDDYVKYMGYQNVLEQAKQEKLFLAAAKSCKIVDEVNDSEE